MSHIEHPPELYCPGCGYDLRALVSERCPECGLVVDLAAIARSEIPWSHRARLGRVNAFIRTVWVVSANWQLIARQAAQPVSYRDAQRFRWIVVLLASLPFCVAALVIRAIIPTDEINLSPTSVPWNSALPRHFDLLVCAVAGLELWVVPSIAILLLVAVITGMPGFFFHPRDLPVARQNRAVALSYYTCAPLVLLFVPVFLLGLATFVQYLDLWPRRGWFQVFALLLLLGGFSFLSIVLLFWWRVTRLLRGMTHCTSTRAMVSAALLPLLWLGTAGVCLGLFPILVGLVRLMIESMRP